MIKEFLGEKDGIGFAIGLWNLTEFCKKDFQLLYILKCRSKRDGERCKSFYNNNNKNWEQVLLIQAETIWNTKN